MNAKTRNKIATAGIYTLVSIVVIILFGILGDILVSGVPHLSWHFLSSEASSYQAGGGVRDQLFNSLYLLVLTLIISLPIALGAGIYLAEYAKDNWFTNLIRTTIEILSSLPSIVVGLFGYLLFVVQFGFGFSIISGALALTFFNLPTLTSNIEQAIEGVPQAQRDAGLALGLSNWKTIRGIVLPAALPGILTGIILSAGRIFGEAAALIYTAGQSGSTIDYSNWNPLSPTSFLNVMRPAETLAVHIWKVNTEGIIPDATIVSAATSALLIIVVILFNLGARALGNHLYRKLTAAKSHKEKFMQNVNEAPTFIHQFDQDEQIISTKDLSVFYGGSIQKLFGASLQFKKKTITALIGGSGSGKSTFLRCLNRMNDKVARVDGEIWYHGLDINKNNINVYQLRKNIGMVFQKPNPFPKSIRENITYALKANGEKDKQKLDQIVEESLRAAALWDEVKDKLDKSALAMSGGQQQRLCIARALALKPEILLLDEPASALDPVSTSKLEDTLKQLRTDYTMIMVTHNMQQASRISDYTAFFHLGHVLEYDKTENIFTNPKGEITEDYIRGSFG